ncbi:MAG: EAL domain-containing protein [Yoonia sp.]|uniref:EAL domain-containing protein n=1 Tax=Yoonia sp. TaxID=2212373 RepID=UPI003EF55CF8
MNLESHKPQRTLADFADIATDWFWETDAEHRFVYFSDRIEKALGIQKAHFLGKLRTSMSKHTRSSASWRKHVLDLKAHRAFTDFEYAITHPDRAEPLWVRISGRPLFSADGVFLGYRGIGHEITDERETIAQLQKTNGILAERNQELTETRRALERSANEDSLTGLLNRRAFERDIAEALGVVGNLVVLLHIDLDRFKWINDTLGHPAGDRVLVKVAERIRNLASGIGPAYRIGGDEFQIVLADNAELARARWMADALIDAMDNPISIDGQTTVVGSSIGIAFGRGGQMTPSQLISNADIALYESKRAGRGCVRELTPCILEQLAARRKLSSQIPNAIAAGEFVPFFQPQIDASNGKVIGAEALARWQHPEHGLLAPAAFLDIATEMGLVPAIDRSMMKQALGFAKQARAEGLSLPSISVNLSIGRLTEPDLMSDIERFWTDQKCALGIELLETTSFDELQQESDVSETIDRLRAMGIRIEIDDFGSGRASITGLLHVRPHRVKIDRSLVQAAVRDPVKRNVVSAILDMTRALGIGVLAEGVEDNTEIAIIRALGCEHFQGYAYARPLSAADFTAYLRQKGKRPKMQTAGPMDLPKLA